MRTGYIPLPNIHLLPQRLWYLYPNVFRDKLNRGNISNTKKVFLSFLYFQNFQIKLTRNVLHYLIFRIILVQSRHLRVMQLEAVQ